MEDSKCVIKAKKFTGDTCVITNRISSDLVKKIDKIAEQTNRNRNDVVSLLLEYAIENVEISK